MGRCSCGNPLASVHLLSQTTVLGEYLRQVIDPLDQALTHGDRQVVSTVYQELQAVFTRVDQWPGFTKVDAVSEPAPAPGSASASASEPVLADPMRALASLLIRDGDAVETVRKGRAEAIRAYLKLRPGLRGVPDARLREFLRAWRAGERSSTVQRVLDEALGVMG